MNRKINITHYKQKETIQGFLDVNISEMNSVVNYSVDMLYCAVLNKVEKNKIKHYLDQMIEKIRYGGQLIIKITNVHDVCKAYVNKSISNKDFFGMIQNISEELNEEEIITYITSKHGFEIIGFENIDYTTTINLQRALNDKN